MTLDSFRLDGKLALVTGGGSGLGRQFAHTLAEAGATVAIAARRREKLKDTAASITKAGGSALCLDLDVTEADSIQSCLARLNEQAGVADILVNNAGVARRAYANEMSEADWDAVVDTNLKGVFMVAQAVANSMLDAGKPGSLINIASVLGLRVTKGLASYVASKAGVVHLTKALALEYARAGIRVNAIAPGYFITEMNEAEFESGAADAVSQRVPMARVGELPEIGGPLLLLASDAGSYMTGSVIAVDGGHLCSSL